MRTISIRLDDHTDAVLTTDCERHGLTQTIAVKAAIEQMALSHQAAAQLVERLGLIGPFRSAEGNLAESHSKRLKEHLQAERARDSAPLQ